MTLTLAAWTRDEETYTIHSMFFFFHWPSRTFGQLRVDVQHKLTLPAGQARKGTPENILHLAALWSVTLLARVFPAVKTRGSTEGRTYWVQGYRKVEGGRMLVWGGRCHGLLQLEDVRMLSSRNSRPTAR